MRAYDLCLDATRRVNVGKFRRTSMPGIIGGLYFLTFISGVVLITLWCMKNDVGPASTGTRGLFAMKDTNPKQPGQRRRELGNEVRERR